MIDHRPTHPYGPFGEIYQEFFELSPRYTGYEFGYAPQMKVSPPAVSFPESLKWYSLDRARRRAAIRRVRDRYIEDILRLVHGRREERCAEVGPVVQGESLVRGAEWDQMRSTKAA